MHLHAPHVSAYFGHNQAHIPFSHPFFYLYLSTLANAYTLGVCCTGSLFAIML
jgi:hypothetical protein